MRKQFPALVLILSVLLCATVRAAGPQLEIHPPAGPVEAGEDFTVTVNLTGNPGILNIEFTLSFEQDKMECTKILRGSLMSEAGASAVNPAAKTGAIIAAASAFPIEDDGPVATYQFTAKEKLTDFRFSIERMNIADRERKTINVSVVTVAPDAGTAVSGMPAPYSDETSTDSGTSTPDTGTTSSGTSTPDTGTTGSGTSTTDTPDTGKTNGATSTPDTGKTNGATSTPDTGKTNGATSTPDTGKTNGATSTPDTGKTDTPDTGKTNGATSTPDTGITGSGASSTSGGTSAPDTGNAGKTEPVTNTAPRFTDTAGTWAETYINTAAERNLFQGYADGTFRPANRLSRAQFMMVLWNLAGRPETSASSPFTDMSGQIENFQKAVAWAYAQGYVNGTSETTFSPGEPLTRQAAMKILFAYNGSRRGPEAMMTGAYDSIYTDSGRISSWARDAIYWAVYQNILTGTSPTTLEPGGTVTRAQLAAIMVRYTDRFPS